MWGFVTSHILRSLWPSRDITAALETELQEFRLEVRRARQVVEATTLSLELCEQRSHWNWWGVQFWILLELLGAVLCWIWFRTPRIPYHHPQIEEQSPVESGDESEADPGTPGLGVVEPQAPSIAQALQLRPLQSRGPLRPSDLKALKQKHGERAEEPGCQ